MLTPRLVTTERGVVEVAEAGRGPALLVIHGLPGDWRQARTLATDLADSWRVLLPSRPGYGRTPLDTGRTPDEQADALAALLDALAEPVAAVVGISCGGPASRALATRHPARVSALLFMCAMAVERAEVPAALRVLGAVPRLWELAARVETRRRTRLLRDPVDARRHAVRGLTPAERADLDDEAIEDLVTFSRDRLAVATCVAGMRNDFRQFRAGRLAGVAPWPAAAMVPTLVLHGDADTVIPLDHGEQLAAAIPGARLEVLPGAGHGFLLTRRRATADRIRRFLTEEATA